MASQVFSKLMNHNFDLLGKEENMVAVQQPTIFVGDIHGQFYDMHKMIQLVGRLGEVK